MPFRPRKKLGSFRINDDSAGRRSGPAVLRVAGVRRRLGPGPVGPGCLKRVFIIYHPYLCLSLNTYHIVAGFAVK